MNITEALTYIHSVCWRGSIPGLSRTQELLRRMGNPEKKLKFVHIAGTNGKGSTAAMTASITFAPTGAATAEPPPPCSITVATTYFGSS